MDIQFKANDKVSAEEMQSLAESVGFGPHRSLGRNRAALARSIFVASARFNGQLVGLVRLIGDGAYILHVAGLEVRSDVQNQGIGRRLMKMAVEFARETGVGAGDGFGEFTLFANVGAEGFYEKLGFALTPNGMVLTDTESRRTHQLTFQRQWRATRPRR